MSMIDLGVLTLALLFLLSAVYVGWCLALYVAKRGYLIAHRKIGPVEPKSAQQGALIIAHMKREHQLALMLAIAGSMTPEEEFSYTRMALGDPEPGDETVSVYEEVVAEQTRAPAPPVAQAVQRIETVHRAVWGRQRQRSIDLT